MAIETVGQTEEMRHVPPLSWLIDKLDREIRFGIEALYTSSFESGKSADSATLNELETRLRRICRWLERLGEQARGKRAHFNHDFNLRSRLRSSLSFALDSLNAADPAQFRRRNPSHAFERSKGECIYSTFLIVNFEFEQLVPIAASVDPDLYIKLIEPPYELPPSTVEEPLATIA